MNLKINWGTGILLVIIFFITTMVAVIIFSMNQQVDLVSPDYYPKGVDYEAQLVKSRNTNLLKEKISYSKSKDTLTIRFPDEFTNKVIKGSIQFYYMIDFERDIRRNLELGPDLKQQFLLEEFNKGRYILKIDWNDGVKAYYQEIDLNL